jgi:predicted RNA polymerase sigma factor
MTASPDGSLIPMAYQLQAAIAPSTIRRRAPKRQIAALYDVLLRLDDNPVVAPSHAVAIGMVAGPRAGLELVQRLGTGPRVNADRRFYPVRSHLLVRAGHPAAALAAYRAAARVATNLQQQRCLNRQVARLQGRPTT